MAKEKFSSAKIVAIKQAINSKQEIMIK